MRRPSFLIVSFVLAFAVVALGGLADDRDRPWNELLLIGSDDLGALATLASPIDGRGVLDLL